MTVCPPTRGEQPRWLVNRASELVRRGERPVVLVSGIEALATLKRAKRAGVRVTWPKGDGQPELRPPLEPSFGVHRAEVAHGLAKHAVGVYLSQPPTAPPEPTGDLQDHVDAAAAPVPVDVGVCGAGHVVAYSVPFDPGDVPDSGIVLAEVGGPRTAALADDELTAELLHGDRVGLSVQISSGEPQGSARIQGG